MIVLASVIPRLPRLFLKESVARAKIVDLPDFAEESAQIQILLHFPGACSKAGARSNVGVNTAAKSLTEAAGGPSPPSS